MAAPKTPVERFDFQRIDAARVKKTPQGFLRVSGNLTRVGVLPYVRADGSTYRELRIPEEVFRADSLATMRLVPVTDLHRAMITPRNVSDLQVGIVGEDVEHGETFVTGSALIQREDTIAAVLSKKRCELSPGYRCWVQDEPGTWNGQRYDGVQRDIIYNHMAIGPKNWGRSGPEVALRMDGLSGDAAFARIDSTDLGEYLRGAFVGLGDDEEIAGRLDMGAIEFGMLLDGFIVPDAARLDAIAALIDVDPDTLTGFIPANEKRGGAKNKPTSRGFVTMKKVQIKLDGVAFEIEIPEQLAAPFEQRLAALQTRADSVSTLEADLVVANKTATDTQAKLDAATAPEALEAATAKRAGLLADAKKIAPDAEIDTKLDGKGIQIAALVAAGYAPETFEDRDDAFVEGVFVGAVAGVKTDGAPVAEPATPGTRSIAITPAVVKLDGQPGEIDKYDSEGARVRMVERNRKMSTGALDKTSNRFIAPGA